LQRLRYLIQKIIDYGFFRIHYTLFADTAKVLVTSDHQRYCRDIKIHTMFIWAGKKS